MQKKHVIKGDNTLIIEKSNVITNLLTTKRVNNLKNKRRI